MVGGLSDRDILGDVFKDIRAVGQQRIWSNLYMTNDPGGAEEKLDSFGGSGDKTYSFEFDDTGKVAGYISQDQARVLSMRTA